MDRQRLEAQLRLHEGERLRIYTDTVGKVTVGVGHNLTDRGITQKVSDLLLQEDIDESLLWVRKSFPWFDALDDVRQRVVLDMAFNLGPKLKLFVGLTAALAGQDWKGAHHHMLSSVWARQVGKRATRLAQMMLSGTDWKD